MSAASYRVFIGFELGICEGNRKKSQQSNYKSLLRRAFPVLSI